MPLRLAIVVAFVGMVSATLGCDPGADRASPPLDQTTEVATADRPGASQPGGRRPNVLLILADDQGAKTMGVMQQVQRKLADRGTTYTDAFVSLPECCPSRASVLSGQYAHNHGVLDNTPPRGGYPAFDGRNSLPVWLRRAGYRTGWVGKYLNGYGNPAKGADPLEVPPGWSEWTAPVNHTEFRMFDYTLNHNGELRDYGSEAADYQTDVFAEHADDFVRKSARGSEPFFLAISPLAPHQEGSPIDDRPDAPRNPRPAPRHRGTFDSEPLPTPPSFDEADVSDKAEIVGEQRPLGGAEIERLTRIYRSQLESLLAVDEMVGRLVRTLRQTGQLRETVVIYTSDQGFLFGEHRLSGKNKLYEEALHVPLIIRGAGLEAGSTDDRLASNVDLAPTIVELSGARASQPMDGRSLLGPAPKSGVGGRSLLLELFHPGRYAGVRTSTHAYVDFGRQGVELYDLTRDPLQLVNVAGEPAHREVERRMAAELKRLRDCAGSSCR